MMNLLARAALRDVPSREMVAIKLTSRRIATVAAYWRSNTTVARRNSHDDLDTQPSQPSCRWRLRPGSRGFRAPITRFCARGRSDPIDVGGANNYLKGAAIVDRIGNGGGFWMSGTVRRAGDGAPLGGQRIQISAHTTEGQEHEPQSHGATLTDKDGRFRLEMPQIIPIFGQPHGHLAYDSGEFETVFLRPVMRSAKDKSLEAHFVLQPA